jgi:hypothetical protein
MRSRQNRQKIKTVLKATVFGCLLFAGPSFFILNTRSDYFLYVRFLVGLPGIFLVEKLHLTEQQLPSNADATIFMVILNGVIGALILATLTASWQLLKGDHET